MSIQQMLLAGVPFTPITNTYTSGTGASETIPLGATLCTIKVWGGGGSGAADVTNAAGGGGGGYSESDAISVTPGLTFIFTVGPGGISVTPTNGGHPGTGSSVSAGTQALTTMTANGGGGGVAGGAGGTGGTASGGTTANNSGANGTAGSPGAGGNNGNGTGGGSPGGGIPGGGGAGTGAGSSTAGGTGQVSFSYS
jgi:hypothetical protein